MRDIPIVSDELPSSFIRAFDPEHAESFITQGRIRLNGIKKFRTSGDQRQDSTEGESYVQVPGNVPMVSVNTLTGEMKDAGSTPGHFHRRSEFMNPVFLLCASHPNIDTERLSTVFGRSLVEIQRPSALLKRLCSAASQQLPTGRELLYVDAFPVQYTKGDVLNLPSNHGDRLRLDYGQKPREYEWEREYRIVLAISGPRAGSPDWLDLNLGPLADIARYLPNVVETPSNTR
jgi:hypothetical protein